MVDAERGRCIKKYRLGCKRYQEWEDRIRCDISVIEDGVSSEDTPAGARLFLGLVSIRISVRATAVQLADAFDFL